MGNIAGRIIEVTGLGVAVVCSATFVMFWLLKTLVWDLGRGRS